MYRQEETPNYENMTLKEFISQPQVIALSARYSTRLEMLINAIPYARIGRILLGQQAVIYIDSRKIEGLLQAMGEEGHIEMFPNIFGLLGRTSLEASGIIQVQTQPFLDLKGRGTLIGIIGTGIDYTQKAFQYEDGTSKIRYIWDQTIEGNNPEGFAFGSEYTSEQINQALKTDTPYNIVPTHDTVRTWYVLGLNSC
ncbi:MAG: hypothetical protein FWF46_04970 [Oscillospiraceae bacterium]|nr:hypothetical protein [Oscillospiraceae bacterium]